MSDICECGNPEDDNDYEYECDEGGFGFCQGGFSLEDNESMDGDHDSAMESAGWGTDEDYGYYGDTPLYEEYYGGE